MVLVQKQANRTVEDKLTCVCLEMGYVIELASQIPREKLDYLVDGAWKSVSQSKICIK